MKRYTKSHISDVVGFTSNNENALILADMDKVASEAGITHRAVNRLITNHKSLLMQSGSVRNEITPGSNHKKVYLLNASQCAFIIQRMNSNTAIRLQTQIANVFAYKSHKLLERQAVHQVSKGASKSFHDAIKVNLDSPEGYIYKNFTNLAYKYALGVGVTKMQHLRNAKGTSNKKNYLFPHEIELLSKAMTIIEALLDVGMTYDDIKDHLSNKCLNRAKITFELGDAVYE